MSIDYDFADAVECFQEEDELLDWHVELPLYSPSFAATVELRQYKPRRR